MIKARQLQLEALDTLGKRAAELNKLLDEMATTGNTLDAEAKLYFISAITQRMGQIAKSIHAELHRANSVPGEWHDDECLYGVQS